MRSSAETRLDHPARRPPGAHAGAGAAGGADGALARAIADEWAGRARDRSAGDAADRARQCRDRPRRARPAAFADGPRALRRNRPRLLSRRKPARADGATGERWDALLGLGAPALRRRFRDDRGVTHVAQPPATVERLAHAVAALDPFHLAGLSPLVTIGGSLVAALAVLEHAVTPEEAWQAVSVDERWQLEQWGSGRRGRGCARKPPPGFHGRRPLPGAARSLVLRARSG